ncbi:methylamine dehydrogenase (amicyanin) large subunit [Methylophaga lonarensis]|nr:methylamine dehydrogenase (amicyanin) large subunit [Methylophaga lonarensis]
MDEPTILTAPPSDAKRVYVLDPGAFHMTSQIFTIDGNNSELLGMTDAGKLPHVLLGDNGNFMAVPSTVYNRIARGIRDDYIEVFDTRTLNVIADIDIPEGRFLTAVMEHMATLSTDDKHLLFQQFSPSPAIGLVDLEQQKFVKMMPIPDCYHLFPAPNQNVFMHCRDGSMLQISYDNEGNTQQKPTKVFHPEDDYLFNNPAYSRKSGRLVWPSTNGKIFQANLSESGAEFLKTIEVFSDQQKADKWRPGGWQPVAYHDDRNEIYLLADQRAEWTHKLPSRYVFVIDAASGKQLRRLELGHEITGIGVSQDDKPYLFAVSADDATLYTFDAVTGKELSSIDELGRAPSMVFLPRE